MGLVEEPLVSATAPALAAVYTDKTIVVATEKVLSGYAVRDGVLEYEIPTPAPATALAWCPNSKKLAVIARGRCYIQDIKNRRNTFDFGTTSAVAIAAAGSYIVVASKRRLRFLEASSPTSQLRPPRELGLAVTALDISSAGKAFCALKNNTVAIVDLVAQKVLPVNVQLPAHSPVLVSCFDTAGLIIAGSRGFFITMAGRVVSVVDWAVQPRSVGAIDDGVFGVLVEREVEVRNPLTGSVLAKKSIEAHQLAHNLAIGPQIIGLSFKVAVDDVLGLDPAEAVSLVDHIPDVASDPRVKELRKSYAMTLADEGHYERALSVFSAADTPVSDVVAKMRPIIDDIQTDEPSDMSSVFSSRTARTTRSSPVLDATIRYLVQARRRLAITAASTDTKINVDDASAVDTLLFLCYIKSHSPLVGPLVRVDNYCDVETVRTTLLELGKWKELTAFLSGKSRHDEALELLRDKANDDQIVDYLLRFVPQDFELTAKYSRGPITRNSSLGLKLFEFTPLDKVKVHDTLLEVSSDLAWEVANRWIAMGDETPEIHTRKALKLISDSNPDAEEFLRSSKAYDAKKLLKTVEQPLMRAALYGRLHKHERVLELYIAEKRYDLCEKYCDETYLESPSEGTKATQKYFDTLLAAEANAEMLSLLNSQGDRLDFGAVLKKLPADISCDRIVQYLTKATTKLVHDANTSQLLAATSKVFLAEQAYDVVKAAQVSATVTPTTTCTVCHKRVGKSAIGLTTQGVVHYGCL